MADVLTKGARITGDDRAALGAALAERYRAGESIRALADDIGRSFGFVHGVISEAGVPLRGRGGATRGAAAGNTKPAVRVSSADPATSKPKKTKAKKSEGKKKPDSKKPKPADKKSHR